MALFSSSHVIALLATVACAAALSVAARRPARQRVIRRGLAVVLLGSGVTFVVLDAMAGAAWTSIAPLHLCDIAVFIGTAALLSEDDLAFELLYFWGLAGALPAMLTPDLAYDFPHFRFMFYFAQHGALVVSAVVLAAGCQRRPRRLAPLRAWLWLNVYAAILCVINFASGANFLYLSRKPGAATPLDLFGPWPRYIIGAELLALALFGLFALPFRWRPARSESARLP